MHAIAYVSAASWKLLDEQVERIVSDSRRLNALHGITGALLYCDGNFMQYLEGDEDAVMETFERIRASESHYQLNELMNQPIVEREFTDWSMGFSRPSPDEFVELAASHAVEQRRAFDQIVARLREQTAFWCTDHGVAGTADALQECRNRTRRTDLADKIDIADIDAQFE